MPRRIKKTFIEVSHPEEEEAFRVLDLRLNGMMAHGNTATHPHIPVTPEEDEAFDAMSGMYLDGESGTPEEYALFARLDLRP